MSPADLIAELTASPGRFGLIEGASSHVIEECERLLQAPSCRVGALLTNCPEAPSETRIENMLRPHPLLVEIEVLFAPQLRLDPLALLRLLARYRAPRVASWPGPLQNGHAMFSEPSRADHYDRQVDDILVLRPVERTFPDEPSFEVERWMT